MIELACDFRFEAAHQLPQAPAGHPCRRLHGHSFMVTLSVAGEPDPTTGWLVDYSEIRAAWAPLQELLDHRYLNEVPGLENPTSEILCVWIWERVSRTLPGLVSVLLAETCRARCVYRPTPNGAGTDRVR
jgi:6-pyruvoyltetrahydropterin/6-carboxytetrahydropterin synthase